MYAIYKIKSEHPFNILIVGIKTSYYKTQYRMI